MSDADRWREAFPKIVEKWGEVQWSDEGRQECLTLFSTHAAWIIEDALGRHNLYPLRYPRDFEAVAILKEWLRAKLRAADIVLHDNGSLGVDVYEHHEHGTHLDHYDTEDEALIAAGLAQERRV